MKIGQKFFALNKSVGGLEGHVMRGLVRDVMKEWAFDYGMGLITEPSTEALQELVSMYVTNLASKWQESHKGQSFSEEFTYTPQEMIDGMKETAISTLRGQVLLGLTGVGADALTSLRKGTQGRKNGKLLGFEWEKGDLRKIIETRKFSDYDKGSVLVDNNMVAVDRTTPSYKPAEVDEKGLPTEKLRVKVYAVGNEYIPINAEEMGKAKYLKDNSEYGMYVDVVENNEIADTNRTVDESKAVINGLIDENEGHQILYSVNKDGSVVVPSGDIDAVVSDYIKSNIDNVSAIEETENGTIVTVDGKNTVFTTDESGAQEVSQDEHMHDLLRTVAENRDTKATEEAKAELVREEELQKRYSDVVSQTNTKKAGSYNSAVTKTINSTFSTEEERIVERQKYKAEEQRLSNTIGQAVDEELKDNKAGLFKNIKRDNLVRTMTRGSVLVEGQLAKSMGKSISEIAGKINFVFNPEYVQEGKARMGWTEANADGTYTINLTKLLDQTTAIHELGHVYLNILGQDALNSIDGFSESFKDALEQDGGKIGNNVHEAFAEALENYVNQNVASNPALRQVFNNIIEALRNFVDAVRNVISPEQIKMFDRLFEKGLNEGWTESDDVRVGAQYKTASSYYLDNYENRKNRTEKGDANDKRIVDGLKSIVSRAYGKAVDISEKDGKTTLTFHSDDAEENFLSLMRGPESSQLAKEENLDDGYRFTMYMPGGNTQVIDVHSDNGDMEIFEGIEDYLPRYRDDAFVYGYEKGEEKPLSLVDLYDEFSDEDIRDFTRLLHASPEMFDAFQVFRDEDKRTLGLKWGYGIYSFDNKGAFFAVMKEILEKYSQEEGYGYSSGATTDNESLFLHISNDKNIDNPVTTEQVERLNAYCLDKYNRTLEELADSFLLADTVEDYVNIRGANGNDIFTSYDSFEEYEDHVNATAEACSKIMRGIEPTGSEFFSMVQALFCETDPMWDARIALSGAGFKGIIISDDYWIGQNGEYSTNIDPETGMEIHPTEVVIFQPEDMEGISRTKISREQAEASYKAEEAHINKRKYKTAWTEEEIADKLNKGEFVPTSVLNTHKDEDAVKVERIAQNIIATHENVYESAKEAIDEYTSLKNKMFSELSSSELEEVIELWNKKNLEKGIEFNVEKSKNSELLIKRLNAYANDESPERTTSQWIAKYRNVREGRKNIQGLSLQMEKAGLFNDKSDIDGQKLSEKYPSLNYVADKVKKSAERKNKRVYIDSFVYENALEEILKNSDSIMNALGLDTEFAKGDIKEELESNDEYVESRSVKALLDLELAEEVKDVIQEGRWDGTVARNLAKKYNQAVRDRNLQNATIQELKNRRDQLKAELAQVREDKEFYKREASYKMRLQAQINSLTEDLITLSSAYAAHKLESELYKTKKQLTEAINAKSGDAVSKRLIKEVVQKVMSVSSEDVSNGRIVTIKDEAFEKMPYIKTFLEDNGFLVDGQLVKGIDDMTIPQMIQFKKAVKQDKKISRDKEAQRKADFANKVSEDAVKVISTMHNSKLAKLTNEDQAVINEKVEELSAGQQLDDAERARLEEEVRKQVLSAKVESILRDARYGTDEHKTTTKRRGSFGDDFTTFSRLLKNVSPELYKIVMEDGLNVVTDEKYKAFDERYGRFIENMKEITGITNVNKMKKYLKKLLSIDSTIGVIGDKPIDSRLMTSKYFNEILEEDKGIKDKVSDTKYTLQEKMAIYEHSFNDGSLKHLHDGNHISAYEIAWVVDEFENGDLKEYKPVADEIRRVMGEKFEDIYNTVLANENREIQHVDFYSAQMNVDYDVDLGMTFSYSFDDNKVSQKKSFTKDRQFGANPISLNYYSDLRRVIEMQEAYINGATFFKEMDSLFDSKGGNLRNAITEMYDQRTSDRIMQMLDICKNDAVVGNRVTEADSWVSKIRNHYVLARLAFNLSSVFQQGASWFLGFSKYGVGRMWKSTMQFLMHPIQMNNMVYELSPQMRHAVNPMLVMAEDTMSKNPNSVAGKINDALSSFGSKGLILMEKYDHIIRNMLWWTSYQAELDSMSKTNKNLSTDDLNLAQRRATQWVLDIQSSSQAKDNALIYAKGDAIWKNLLMFTNQMNKEWNMLWNDAIKQGILKGDVGKFFANFAALGMATMWVVFSTGKIKNGEDDDETWIEDLLQDFGTEFVSRIPVGGQIAKNALEGFTYEQTDDPITRTIELIKKLSSGDSEKTKTAIKNEVWSILDIIGAPTTMVKRGYRSFEGGDFLQADHFLRQLGGEWYKYFE